MALSKKEIIAKLHSIPGGDVYEELKIEMLCDIRDEINSVQQELGIEQALDDIKREIKNVADALEALPHLMNRD
jgi:hypothetical protein